MPAMAARHARAVRAGRRAYGRGIEGRKIGALELRLYMRLRLRGEDASCIRRNPVHSRVAAATRRTADQARGILDRLAAARPARAAEFFHSARRRNGQGGRDAEERSTGMRL